jgi:cytochrome c553
MKSLSRLFLLTSLLAFTGVAAAAGDAAAGKTKAAACAGCHGPDGNAPAAQFPRLAGQGVRYLVKQMQDFKAAKTDKDAHCTVGRCDATMQGMVAGLSEQDMTDIAAFYAAQKPKIGQADAAVVKRGEHLYRGGDKNRGLPSCMGCHGPDGNGNAPAGYPRLGGQHADYTVKQMRAFQTRDRANDPNSIMRDIASRMEPDEIKAVASYVQGLHHERD